MVAIIACVLFLLDITLQAIWYDYITQTLLWFYIISILNFSSVAAIITLIVLLNVQSFMQWHHYFLELTYLIPATLAAFIARTHMHRNYILPIALCGATFIMQQFFVEYLYFGASITGDYTIRKFFINIISICVLSLTVYRRGNLGDRL